ncbi:hypothetical protein, partial [Citrobacter sp. Cpa228]|uniref:hypothetical protein n=1 Tax=Citrobacter sp. Cpa228 TaxID=2985119 RepID=UPI0025787BE2
KTWRILTWTRSINGEKKSGSERGSRQTLCAKVLPLIIQGGHIVFFIINTDVEWFLTAWINYGKS